MDIEKLEIDKISRKVNEGFDRLRGSSEKWGMNEVKTLKNDMFLKTSKVFIYNLKKLIQLEGTQKNLARKIGVSEDLLSKYKAGEAFPSIETIIYIGDYYNIDLSKLISTPLTIGDVEAMAFAQQSHGGENMFEHQYFAYFFVTNKMMDRNIHEGLMEISGEAVNFKILSGDRVVKEFTGRFRMTEKLAFFELRSIQDGNAYINMIRPNINKNKYVGGLGLLMLPSDANSKPCAQKIMLSRHQIDREKHYKQLKELLSIHCEREAYGNVKISQLDDEMVFDFISEI